MLHLDVPSPTEIQHLIRERATMAVSIYLETTPITQDIGVSRITLKNMVKQAIVDLKREAAEKRQLWAIEEQIAELADDDDFWAHQARCLAIFVTPDLMRTYRLANRIGNQVHISDRFHIQPLLRAVAFPHTAFVLMLAEGGVKLYEMSADEPPAEVRVPDLPKDAYKALGKTTLNDRDHSGRIHGTEGKTVRLEQYVRIVDKALRHVLAGRQRPLIIAAAEPLASLFRQVNSYPHVAKGLVKGNVEHLSPMELGQAARAVLDEHYAAELDEVRSLYETRASQGRASADVAQIARAATFGAVDTLLVDMDAVVPGTVDEDSGAIHPSDRDDTVAYGIIDEIAGRVILSGGRVLAVRQPDVPEGGKLAAILRYPM